jgi:hypothetical protein
MSPLRPLIPQKRPCSRHQWKSQTGLASARLSGPPAFAITEMGRRSVLILLSESRPRPQRHVGVMIPRHCFLRRCDIAHGRYHALTGEDDDLGRLGHSRNWHPHHGRAVARFIRHPMVSGKTKKRTLMIPISSTDEFLKPAAECQQMAKAKAPQSVKASGGSCGHWHVDGEPVTFPPPFFPKPHGAMIAVDQGQQPG